MKKTFRRILITLLCTFLSLLLFQSQIFAQCTSSSGPRSGTVFSDDGSIGSYAFSSPGNAAASDGNRAVASAIITLFSGDTHYLKATGFGFSIPPTATVCGILVEVEKSASNISILAWVTDNSVRLLKNGNPTGNDYWKSAAWSSSDNYFSYGGTSDTWGMGIGGWSGSDINSPDFGIIFSAAITGIVALLPKARINHIRITVSYFAGVPLPLSLTGFSAGASENHSAKLTWTTTNNDETATFAVQRSSNGIDWTTINSQRGEVTVADKTYQYTDISCTDKSAYYRIQVQQASGRISYSAIQNVKWQPASFSIYPNPAASLLYIEQKESIQFLQCVGMDGRNWPVTYRQTASDIYQADVSKLPRGSYILCINEKRKLFLLE